MNFIKLKCQGCGKIRKFRMNSKQHLAHLCGECWDWTNEKV